MIIGFFASAGQAVVQHETSGLLPAEYKSDIQSVLLNFDVLAGGDLIPLFNLNAQVQTGQIHAMQSVMNC